MTLTIAFLAGASLTLGLLALLARTASFRAQRPQHYAAKGPAFDLTRHMAGPMVFEGVVYGPTGRVTSRFLADAFGEWQGGTGTLREHFRFDTGTRQDRVWSLIVDPDGRITGTAPDVIGTATGQVMGSAVQLRYRIRLSAQAGGHVLSVTDWMYLMENGTIINRSQMTKFGLRVAELVATIRPVAQADRVPLALAAE